MTARFDLAGYIGEGEATAQAVQRFLAENTMEAVMVVVNSPGGLASEGAAIAAEFARHGNVTAVVQGIAASAASFLLTGARQILMHEAAVLMIHEPSAWAGGTAKDLRELADTLDKLTSIYAAGYSRATGHSVARIANWMKAETWMDAQEALDLRFIDQIETSASPQIVARHDYTQFRAAPETLVQMTLKNGWGTASSESNMEN